MEKARYPHVGGDSAFLLARFAVVPLFGLSPTIFWLYVPSIMAFFYGNIFYRYSGFLPEAPEE